MKNNNFREISRDAFSISLETRALVNRLDNVIVSYPSMTAAYKGLIECVTSSESSKEPVGAVLVGMGGMGKTTICNMILDRFSEKTVSTTLATTRTRPAFYSSVPSPSTIKSLAANLLESLGDPFPKKGSANVLTTRLYALLKQCETRIILLDEFHHLLVEGSTNEKRIHKICNWLKSLINNTGVMVCLIGTPSCEALVNFDSQMARRFMHRYRLSLLDIGTSTHPGPLAQFVRSLSDKYMKEIQLTGMLDFSSPFHIQQMWASTSGNPAFISALLKEAIVIALIDQRRTVDQNDFALAFDRMNGSTVKLIDENPFRMTTQQLAIALGEKKLRGALPC